MEEVRIESWQHLQEELYRDSWQESLGHFRSNYAFRGMPDAREGLPTHLMRLGRGYERVESPLLRAFRKYAPRSSVPGDSTWNWLAIAAHHGLPTRLLDWTYSPFVAIHFATDDPATYDREAAIWCVDYSKARAYLPDGLRRILQEEGAYVFTAEMLSRGAPGPAELERHGDNPYVLFLEPPSVDERIINQYALFALMSSATARLDDWLHDHSELARRLLIPAALKWEVRDKLDQANITERVLFPGLDGLSSWLRRYYTPRRA